MLVNEANVSDVKVKIKLLRLCYFRKVKQLLWFELVCSTLMSAQVL